MPEALTTLGALKAHPRSANYLQGVAASWAKFGHASSDTRAGFLFLLAVALILLVVCTRGLFGRRG